MVLKCPKCSRREESDIAELGDMVQCDCGFQYKAGFATVKESDFSRLYADVPCPYCDAINALPSDAVNRNVLCGTCGERFHVSGKAPTYGKEYSGHANDKDKDPPFFRIVFIFIAFVFSPLIIIVFAKSSWPLTWVDDDVCAAKYVRELTNKNYESAREWANRMKDDINRKSALQVIDGTENGMRSMGY